MKTKQFPKLLGVIAGDIIGSRFERDNIKQVEFDLFTNESRFTDDSVMTLAIADAFVRGGSFVERMQHYGRMFPRAGYGKSFRKWIGARSPQPYNSWGNGSAMRVGAVAYVSNSVDEVLSNAKKTAEVTHNHPHGIAGAQAIALCMFLARKEASKSEIQQEVANRFEYDLTQPIDEIRPVYSFDVSCQGSVPQAICAFLESKDLEDAIRLGISIGGDSDTIAAMAGGIAELFYGEMSVEIKEGSLRILDASLLDVLLEFDQMFS